MTIHLRIIQLVARYAVGIAMVVAIAAAAVVVVSEQAVRRAPQQALHPLVLERSEPTLVPTPFEALEPARSLPRRVARAA